MSFKIDALFKVDGLVAVITGGGTGTKFFFSACNMAFLVTPPVQASGS
jgi:hypothetical protein